MDIINVGLYGGKGLLGGRETPLQASVVSCDKHQSCSYYQNNQCLKVRSIGTARCMFGSVSTIQGYTSKAKKYREFKNQWENHEQYSKLKYPSTKLGLIDNFVVFPYSFVRIVEQEDGEYKLDGPLMFSGDTTAFIPLEKFTTQLIHRLCTFRPQAIMGGEIKDYREKVVPMFISHLKEVLTDKYEELIDQYEGYAEKLNYVGRTALLTTVQPSTVHYKSSRYPEFNEEWYWDGTHLTYKGGHVHKFNVTNDYEVEEIRIKPSEKSKITISNNDQVASQTVFID